MIEDQHLILLLPEVLQAHLLSKDHRAEPVPKDGAQHLDQLLVVEVLYSVEVVEVQEYNFASMRGQEGGDLLEAFSHGGAEQAVCKEELVVGVSGFGGYTEVKEADACFQLAGEVHGLRSQPFSHQLLGDSAKHRHKVLHRLRLLRPYGGGLINVETEGVVGT